MKLKRNSPGILGVLVLAICIFFIVSSLTANAGETEEDLVRSVLKKYEAAAQKHDVDSIVQFSLDLSWPKQEQFKANVVQLDEKVYKFETISLERVEKDLYKATVLAETESLKETQMVVPVLNINGQWKVIVGQDVHDGNSQEASQTIKSAEFYKSHFTNQPNQ